MIKKVSKHLVQNESLLFEQSSPGKRGYQLPPLDVPPVDADSVLGAAHVRSEIEDFPEVSELKHCATSRACPLGIMLSISAFIRSVPAR